MMNRLRGSLKYGVVILSLALAGCATVPESIKGSGTTMLTDFQAVQKRRRLTKDGSAFRRAGTQRAESAGYDTAGNRGDAAEQHRCAIPRFNDHRPDVCPINSFMEPDNFRDQYVTVVGLMNGTQAGKIGDVPYTFPVIDVTGFQRWHRARQVIMPPPVYGPDPWRWHNGYYGGGYYGGGWYYPPGPAVVQDYLVP